MKKEPVGEDIQVENGRWLKIHNLLLEKIYQVDLGSEELRVLLCVIRLTYGYNKKEAEIGSVEIAQATGLLNRNVKRALKLLEERNMIHREGGGQGRGKRAKVGINKYFETWREPEKDSNRHLFGTNKRTQSDTFYFDKIAQSDTFLGSEKDSNRHLFPSGLNTVEEKTVGERQEKSSPPPPPKIHTNGNGNGTVSKPPVDDKDAQFVKAYEHIWGMMIGSAYIGDQIRYWATKVTVEGWEYALKESLSNRSWRYLEKILGRIEREGFKPKGPTAAPEPVRTPESSNVVDFYLEDIDK